jgi:hypothetical protein
MKMLIEMNAGDPTLALNRFFGFFEFTKSIYVSDFYLSMNKYTSDPLKDRRRDTKLLEKFI